MSDHRRTVPLHDRYGAYGRYTWEGEGGGGGGTPFVELFIIGVTPSFLRRPLKVPTWRSPSQRSGGSYSPALQGASPPCRRSSRSRWHTPRR